MPERPDFWGIPIGWNPALLTYTIMALATLVLLGRLVFQARLWWRVGRPEERWDRPLVRLGRVITIAVAQTRVLSQRYPGVMHAALAWSFIVFFAGTTLAAIDGHLFKFLLGNVYLVFKLVLDVFAVVFLVGAGMAAYRRLVTRPSRLTLRPGFVWSLALIVVIVAGGLVTESLRLAAARPDWGWWAPTGNLLAQGWLATGATSETLANWHTAVWSFHLATVVVLFVTLPAGTLLHIPTSLLNTYFSKLDRPMGKLKPLAQSSTGEPLYVHTLRDLTWKQLLDGDACTECGRCQDACPSYASGAPLSPKQMILALREALHRDGASLLRDAREAPQLIDGAITDAMVWSCTTCGACLRECPVLIEHVDAIVDLRRYLVGEGRMDGRLQETLAKVGRYGNSFGQSERARAKWAQPIQPKIKDARKEPVEYLWFVGDYASYSAGLTEVTRATAKVFQAAGMDFGILYEGERSAGNDVRRVGEEGLYEMLVEQNAAVLARSKFNAIVTTDPHTYNTLKHEYPEGAWSETRGAAPPVYHYAQVLDGLIGAGKLKLSKKLGYRVTYHDPCYLGRYNGVYDAPRRVIEATGCKLIEMPRHRDRALCCGAGGGRIWMEEGAIKERPSEARIREAAALAGVDRFVAACPKDITMFRDAVKTAGYAERLVVQDLIELVQEAL
ncbi:MAG: heterodisulfide reductase-related iron-sulfur binding cluster [Chloroflexi bacterium]|nr:heterodisulfide reductase-related iron-sulfur binding cluster [Chloroflexota bacterium]